MLTHQQITDGNVYDTSYQYNAFGALISETYPSGRTVKYEFNQDGEIARIGGTKGTQNTLYANAISYNSAGAMERLRLGNGKWETAKYNERLQVTQIGLGNSATDTSLLKLEFDYGNNTQNNGSMRSQKISFNGLSQPFEQTYAYDDLNRLQSATETVNSGATTTWKQTFQYDRFGNRRIDAANTTTIGTSNKVTNPLINTSDNRLKKDQDNDTITDYDYDKTGNLTQDSEGKTFLYDAENHQKEVFVNGVSKGKYLYDGDGRRVKKISDLETTIFVYNGGGQLVAEYSTQQSATPQVSYLTADHLGSPRIITDNVGKVIARKDFNAFGDETASTQRTDALGYKPEEIRQDYTGYQKDDESGLEFAQARYYNTKHGRFTSVDPLVASANVKDPQTFNRYSYAMNSPYKFTDPLGLLSVSTGACGICQGDGGGSFSAKERENEAEEVETQQTAARAEHSSPAVEQNAESLIRIPGIEEPDFAFYYPGDMSLATDGVTAPEPDRQLPKTSAAVNTFVKAISPYIETTAVLNVIEAVTGMTVDSISSTMMGQIAATITKTLSATPSTTVGGTATGSYSQTTIEKGASTLTARTELSAKIVALTLDHQANIKAALTADRADNKMSTLTEKQLMSHVTSVMKDGTNFLNDQIKPKTDSLKTVLTDVLKK